jgi:hypothetical protein
MTQTPGFISPAEAHRTYKVPYITLRRWLADGTLTRYEVGGGRVRPRLAIDIAELEQLLTPTRANA